MSRNKHAYTVFTQSSTLSFTLTWNEWEGGSSFYILLPPSRSVFLPSPLYALLFPLVHSHLIKASHSCKAPTLLHKPLGMSDLSLMSNSSWALHYPLADKDSEHFRLKKGKQTERLKDYFEFTQLLVSFLTAQEWV